jgi:hypothetical protein
MPHCRSLPDTMHSEYPHLDCIHRCWTMRAVKHPSSRVWSCRTGSRRRSRNSGRCSTTRMRRSSEHYHHFIIITSSLAHGDRICSQPREQIRKRLVLAEAHSIVFGRCYHKWAIHLALSNRYSPVSTYHPSIHLVVTCHADIREFKRQRPRKGCFNPSARRRRHCDCLKSTPHRTSQRFWYIP